MSVLSSNLAEALNQIPFVQVVEHEQSGNGVNVLCRIKPGSGAHWAALAEYILRGADERVNRPEHWHSHIARVYMIREGRLVYGWVFVIQSNDIAKSMQVVLNLLHAFASQVSAPVPGVQRQQDDDYDTPEPIQEDDDYSEPEAPLPKGYHPEADEKGNPIVPREHRVKSVPMAGLPKNYDRNAPDPEKGRGSWNIEGRKGKAFRPPVRR